MLEVYSIATVQKQSVTCNILTVRSTVDYPQIKYQNLTYVHTLSSQNTLKEVGGEFMNYTTFQCCGSN